VSFRCRSRTAVRRALSWIELLVILLIILLLVFILLPSLNDARRQARVAKCLSNLRALNIGAIQYCLDYRDVFPVTHRDAGQAAEAFSFAYGGKTSDDFWRGVANGAGYITYAERPLNPYLTADQATATERNGPRSSPGNVTVLYCSDDRTTYARAALEPGKAPLAQACYDDVGTSFHFNLHAVTGTNIDGRDENGENWSLLSQAMFRVVLAKSAGTFVAFLPDPTNYALGQHVQIRGNHGQLGRHEMGFLDGHAEYRVIDTTRWSGDRWTALVPEWSAARDSGARSKVQYVTPDKMSWAPATR
jgi:hypothetical protein